MAPVLAALLAIPGPAAAQACVGRPVGGLAAGAVVAEVAHARYDAAAGTEDGARGSDVGAGFWANPRGFLAYSAGYTRRIMAGGDANLARLGIVAELPPSGILPPGGGFCLVSGVSGSWYEPVDPDDRRRTISVPLGIAAGLVIPAGSTTRLYPYLSPQLVLSSTGGGSYPRPADPSSGVGIESGVGFARAAVVGRGRVRVSVPRVGPSRPPFPDLGVGVELGIRF